MSSKRKRSVAVATLGCKVNQFESASFLTGFEKEGVSVVPFSHPADIYIVNTCAVTAKAASQSRQMIRRAMRINPEARVVVTGCYSQVEPKEVLKLSDQPVCIVGNGLKDHLVDIALSEECCDLEMFMGDIGRKKEICPLPVRKFAGRTRAFLKIQDGCNQFCSYCVVPYARGRSRSLAMEKVLEQVEVFAREGYKEIVLTGIHVGTYGRDLSPQVSFYDLLALLAGQKGDVRYRISSLEPREITSEILELLANTENFMPHLHIPLQSGDDRILKKMNRRYTVSDFTGIISECIKKMPEIAIGVDVLVGFPGESEEAFGHTVDLLESLPIAYLHVFPYSKRPSTLAAGMDKQLPNKVKEERVRLLRELDHKKRTAFYGRFVGATQKVLAETSTNRFRLMRGFTENYIPVYFQAPESVKNQVVKVKIERLVDRSVFGALCAE